MNLKDSISNFINLFIPTSKMLRKEFYTTIARENYKRLFFVSVFYFLFELRIQLVLPPAEANLNQLSIFILCFHTIAVIISIWKIKSKKIINGVLSQWIISFYCLALLFWSVNVTLSHIYRPGSTTMFIVTLAGTSAVFYRRTLITLLTNIGYYLYFVYQMQYVVKAPNGIPPGPLGGPELNLLYISDALLVTGLCCIIGVTVFRLRLRVFLENKALEDLALMDAMTGVLNHNAICSALKSEIQRSERYSLPLSILIIDIDHFKGINDTYGHLFGDEVIVGVTKVISESCRETDYVGRYGGDEFLVILTNTSDKEAMELSERLRTRVEGLKFENDSQITVSCGLMKYDDESHNEMILKADKALYDAKKNGRNRIESA